MTTRFILREAVMEDADAIAGILQHISDEIDDPTIFVADDKNYVERHISHDGFILVAVDGHTIAGFLLVDFPEERDYNLANDLEWKKETLLKSAHMDIACVLPEYRGSGLQKVLLREAERILVSRGFQYALATVYPGNKPSLNSLVSAGYTIGATKPKYGGVLRHIVWKDLTSDRQRTGNG